MTTAKKSETKSTENKFNIYQKIQFIQADIQELVRNEENKFQKYWYFDELQVLRHLKPLLDKWELTLLISDDETKEFLCEPAGNMWLVKYGKKCEIIDSSAEEKKLTYYFWAAALNQDPAKAKGSAETYSIKYFLAKLFLIPVKDEEDPDHGKKEVAKESESPNLKKVKDWTKPIKATLTDIKTKLDKNQSKYLLLETDLLPNNVFVFDYKVESARWTQLKTGQTYRFHCEESPNGLLTLLDFENDK